MSSTATEWTIDDLLEQFGTIPVTRVRLNPPPGTATEQDVIEIEAREDRLYELIDGVLLEKGMGSFESYRTVVLVSVLNQFVRQHAQ
jgi:hypothetical protein